MRKPILVCFKWGTRYEPEYVNALYRNAKKHTRRDFSFVCVTDDATGLDTGCETVDLEKLRRGFPEKRVSGGNWQKLLLYSRNLFEEDDTVLFMDLDIVIVGSLDDFFVKIDSTDGLILCPNTRFPQKKVSYDPNSVNFHGNSSVVGFRPGRERQILDRFIEHGPSASVWSEQSFVCDNASDIYHWDADWVANFKRDCALAFPQNLWRIPQVGPNTRVVIFPGSIKPKSLAAGKYKIWGTRSRFGFGNVPWVKEYWEEVA